VQAITPRSKRGPWPGRNKPVSTNPSGSTNPSSSLSRKVGQSNHVTRMDRGRLHEQAWAAGPARSVRRRTRRAGSWQSAGVVLLTIVLVGLCCGPGAAEAARLGPGAAGAPQARADATARWGTIAAQAMAGVLGPPAAAGPLVPAAAAAAAQSAAPAAVGSSRSGGSRAPPIVGAYGGSQGALAVPAQAGPPPAAAPPAAPPGAAATAGAPTYAYVPAAGGAGADGGVALQISTPVSVVNPINVSTPLTVSARSNAGPPDGGHLCTAGGSRRRGPQEMSRRAPTQPGAINPAAWPFCADTERCRQPCVDPSAPPLPTTPSLSSKRRRSWAARGWQTSRSLPRRCGPSLWSCPSCWGGDAWAAGEPAPPLAAFL
jgi:hypothetical protein